MSIENYESEAVTSGFVLASTKDAYDAGSDEQYTGELDVHFVDGEESYAGHWFVLGLVRVFRGAKNLLLIFPKGTFPERIMPERRSWKQSFTQGFDPEHPSYEIREDLTMAQKSLLVRAWAWFAKKAWGWDGKTVPDAIPRYSERRGWFHVPAIDPQMHHIEGVGESTRLHGDKGYNRPDNIAPVSARWHVGRGVRPNDPMEDEVIHPDTMDALRGYGKFKKDGGKNPMHTMHDDRGKHTKAGKPFHNPIHDEYLTDLSKNVWDTYTADHPEDRWQSKKKKKGKK